MLKLKQITRGPFGLLTLSLVFLSTGLIACSKEETTSRPSAESSPSAPTPTDPSEVSEPQTGPTERRTGLIFSPSIETDFAVIAFEKVKALPESTAPAPEGARVEVRPPSYSVQSGTFLYLYLSDFYPFDPKKQVTVELISRDGDTISQTRKNTIPWFESEAGIVEAIDISGVKVKLQGPLTRIRIHFEDDELDASLLDYTMNSGRVALFQEGSEKVLVRSFARMKDREMIPIERIGYLGDLNDIHQKAEDALNISLAHPEFKERLYLPAVIYDLNAEYESVLAGREALEEGNPYAIPGSDQAFTSKLLFDRVWGTRCNIRLKIDAYFFGETAMGPQFFEPKLSPEMIYLKHRVNQDSPHLTDHLLIVAGNQLNAEAIRKKDDPNRTTGIAGLSFDPRTDSAYAFDYAIKSVLGQSPMILVHELALGWALPHYAGRLMLNQVTYEENPKNILAQKITEPEFPEVSEAQCRRARAFVRSRYGQNH